MSVNSNARGHAITPTEHGSGEGSSVPEDGLLVDASGFVLDAGERAAGTLRLLQPLLKERGPKLCRPNPARLRCRLAFHLRRLLDSAQTSMLVRLSGPSEHAATFVLLTRYQAPGWTGRLPERILVTLRRPALLDWIDAGVLRDAFELTSRELDVVTGLASGHTLASYAEDRHLSVYTVRTQVKQVLRKMGVHTQHQAVALALSLARRA